jgi:hypothetical protein
MIQNSGHIIGFCSDYHRATILLHNFKSVHSQANLEELAFKTLVW